MRPPRRRPDGARAERGRQGEALAAEWLRARGWRCTARNLRTRGGEIDLLVRRGKVWAAVEVKTRSGHPAPERLVDDASLARLTRALEALAPHLTPRPRRLLVLVVAVRLLEDGAAEIVAFEGGDSPI